MGVLTHPLSGRRNCAPRRSPGLTSTGRDAIIAAPLKRGTDRQAAIFPLPKGKRKAAPGDLPSASAMALFIDSCIGIGSAFLTLAGCSCFGTIWLVGVGILVSFGRGGVGCVDGAAVTACGLLRWVLLGDTCGWMVLG